MNSWCESCARKNCCYTMEIRPRCYVATTNTASGTPESYLAKSLRYSRDSHEIAKDEPQTPYDNCKSCKWWFGYCHLNECDYTPIEDEPQTSCKTCRYGEVDGGYVRCAYYSKATEQDEPQTERSSE